MPRGPYQTGPWYDDGTGDVFPGEGSKMPQNTGPYRSTTNPFKRNSISPKDLAAMASSQELIFLKNQNNELMRLLGIILEDKDKLKEFPALQEAYNEYLFVRKLILGDIDLD